MSIQQNKYVFKSHNKLFVQEEPYLLNKKLCFKYTVFQRDTELPLTDLQPKKDTPLLSSKTTTKKLNAAGLKKLCRDSSPALTGSKTLKGRITLGDIAIKFLEGLSSLSSKIERAFTRCFSSTNDNDDTSTTY